MAVSHLLQSARPGVAQASHPQPTGPWRPTSAPIDPLADPPDPALTALLPPVLALREGLLPWRQAGAVTVVLCDDVERAAPHLPLLTGTFGTVRLATAEPGHLALALREAMGRRLVARAEVRRPAPESCRSLPGDRLALWAASAALIALAVLLLAPVAALALVSGLAALALLTSAGLRLAAVAVTLRVDRRDEGAQVVPARLPVISLLVPLYQEREVARSIVRRVDALDYPRDLLDLCLIVEDDDGVTRLALESARLPPWAQIVEVPGGTIRTKPRALNYALDFARGSILGIYDAEDVPAPDHLRRVAELFARRGPRTACLQGALDYFNWQSNWLARCFTLEYASWFRVLLPGVERLGLAVPLGGTTLFLRREAIEALGGWDAHNVTEDADLGLRLARRGYRTEMIPITTQEEANARAWPWVRQRSRWLKGYAVTWAVHMRDPVALWRDLGPRAFWGVQVMFLGTLLQFALAPLLWSFGLVPLGLPHPLAGALPPGLLVALSILFLGAQMLDLGTAWVGARRAGKAQLAPWSPSLLIYFPLATLAVWRALWEAATCPFRWDKTEHGIDAPPVAVTPPPAPSPRRA